MKNNSISQKLHWSRIKSYEIRDINIEDSNNWYNINSYFEPLEQ